MEEDMRRISVRFDCAQVILLDNQPVGLLKVSRDDGDWDLRQIQIAPSLQGQGLGTRLIQSVITEAQHADASLKLKVLRTNPAHRLHARLGFSVFAENAHRIEMRFKA